MFTAVSSFLLLLPFEPRWKKTRETEPDRVFELMGDLPNHEEHGVAFDGVALGSRCSPDAQRVLAHDPSQRVTPRQRGVCGWQLWVDVSTTLLMSERQDEVLAAE